MTTVEIPGVSSAWLAPESMPPSQWADGNLVLDPLVNADGGRYRTSVTPYVVEWLDSAGCSWVRQVSIVAGTQIGKTTAINGVLGYAIAQDPGPVMVVVPRTSDVPTFHERRFMPLVRSSPALAAELTDRAHDAKRREILFRRSVVYLRSSQSPADLASVPVRYLLADEVDKFPGWSGREASPLDLARERMRTFWNAVCYVTSTPTVPGGAIWGEWLDGDRRRYWVPCPHCGRHQVLRFAQVKFDASLTAAAMRRQRQAHYECEHCKREIDDQAKRGMLAAGVWCPESAKLEEWRAGGAERDRADHRSYHLWAGYSPWLTWWKIAAQFLASKDNPARLQNWVNSWLAEPWVEKLDAPTDDVVRECMVPGFRMGQIPDGCLVATAGCDVQKDRIYYVVRGWGLDEESWLLACGQAATFAELEDVLCRNVWGKRRTGVTYAVCDFRYRRDEVLELARRRPVIQLGVGVDRSGPLDFSTNRLDRHPLTGAPLPNSLLVWSITVGRFKDYVASRMRRAATWHLPEDVPENYRRQVVSEHKIRVRSGARESERWVVRPGSEANHLWDCEVYASAAARMIHVEQLKRPPADGAGGAAASPPRRPPPPRSPSGPPRFPRLSR